MIHSFTITNHLGDSIFLDIRKPEDTGFLVASVAGLETPKAEISSEAVASYDGTFVGNIRAEERNIVFTIIFYDGNNEKLSIEELRHRCYKFFPLKKEITIKVVNDSGTYITSGYIEANETNIFTEQEGAQISVICPDPYFWEDTSETIYLYNAIPAFQFPVKFEDYQEFARVNTYQQVEMDYRGVGDCGITIDISSVGNASGLIFYDLITNQYMKLNSDMLIRKTGNDISKGDHITINTRKGSKSAILIRNGRTYNILQCLDISSSWIMLHQGTNRFGYISATGSRNLKISISYETNYFGV